MTADSGSLRSSLTYVLSRIRLERSSIIVPISMTLALGTALRVYAFVHSPTVTYHDTIEYVGIAAEPFTSPQWWIGSKPPTTSLAYLLAGSTIHSFLRLQWALGLLSWSVLAAATARLVDTRWLKPVAAGVVVAFSLSREITEWDRIALSDSISLSLLALLATLLLLYVERPDRRLLVAILGVAAIWAFTRDANAYDVLFMAPVFLVAALVAHRHRTLHAVAAIGCLTIFAGSFASANAAQRWEYPFYNVLSIRILEDPAATQYFVANGMPMSPALRQRAGKGGADNAHYYRDPRLRPVQLWTLANAKRVYLTYLLTHPRAAILTPGSNPAVLVSNLRGVRKYAPRAWTADGGLVSAWTFPDLDVPGLVLINAMGFALACGLTLRFRRRWLVPALMIATAVPLAFVIYHADAGDVSRHELVPAVQIRLGLWLLLVMAVDAVSVSRSGVRSPRHRDRRAIPGSSEPDAGFVPGAVQAADPPARPASW